MQPDLFVGDRPVDIKSFSMTCNNPLNPRPPGITSGKFDVSGTMTVYFSNEALLAAILSKPHKAAVWDTLRPKLYRVAAHALVAVAASFLLIAGAT